VSSLFMDFVLYNILKYKGVVYQYFTTVYEMSKKY